jgi:hypothetical protein
LGFGPFGGWSLGTDWSQSSLVNQGGSAHVGRKIRITKTSTKAGIIASSKIAVATLNDQFKAKAHATPDKITIDINISVRGLRPHRKISGMFGWFGSAHLLSRPVHRSTPRTKPNMEMATTKTDAIRKFTVVLSIASQSGKNVPVNRLWRDSTYGTPDADTCNPTKRRAADRADSGTATRFDGCAPCGPAEPSNRSAGQPTDTSSYSGYRDVDTTGSSNADPLFGSAHIAISIRLQSKSNVNVREET